jgi:hypothetical protein
MADMSKFPRNSVELGSHESVMAEEQTNKSLASTKPVTVVLAVSALLFIGVIAVGGYSTNKEVITDSILSWDYSCGWAAFWKNSDVCDCRANFPSMEDASTDFHPEWWKDRVPSDRGSSYVGCFADNSDGDGDGNDDRDLPISTPALDGWRSQSTRTALIDCGDDFYRCAGYKYMGLQWDSECWCGNSYGSQGSAECPDDCGLEGSTDCGSRNAVYSGAFFLPSCPPAAPFGPPSLYCTKFSSAYDLKINNPGPTDTIWAMLSRF